MSTPQPPLKPQKEDYVAALTLGPQHEESYAMSDLNGRWCEETYTSVVGRYGLGPMTWVKVMQNGKKVGGTFLMDTMPGWRGKTCTYYFPFTAYPERLDSTTFRIEYVNDAKDAPNDGTVTVPLNGPKDFPRPRVILIDESNIDSAF